MPAVAHSAPQTGRAKSRLTGFLLALLLQAGFITALVIGLKVAPIIEKNGGIETFFPKTHSNGPPPQLPQDPNVRPDRVFAPEPVVRIDTGPSGGTELTLTDTTPHPAPIANHGPISLVATHTIPTYPPLAIRLGQQGTVTLRLAISPQGLVTGATIVRSSGFQVLDDAAVAWVMTHWRYQPAVRGGVAVPSGATVGVKFDLRNAG